MKMPAKKKKSQCLFVANVRIGWGEQKAKCLTEWLNYLPSGPALLSETENCFFLWGGEVRLPGGQRFGLALCRVADFTAGR